MGSATKRERLDDPARSKRASNLAWSEPFAPGTDGELGRGVELGRHGAQTAHDARDRFGADRIEQLPPHTPCEGPTPGE
jgi:hypothetical protein